MLKNLIQNIVPLIIAFIMACAFFLFVNFFIIEAHKVNEAVFTNMDEARSFQRECLNNGNSVLIHEHSEGIEMICRGH